MMHFGNGDKPNGRIVVSATCGLVK